MRGDIKHIPTFRTAREKQQLMLMLPASVHLPASPRTLSRMLLCRLLPGQGERTTDLARPCCAVRKISRTLSDESVSSLRARWRGRHAHHEPARRAQRADDRGAV